jgi:hypothetical protein
MTDTAPLKFTTATLPVTAKRSMGSSSMIDISVQEDPAAVPIPVFMPLQIGEFFLEFRKGIAVCRYAVVVAHEKDTVCVPVSVCQVPDPLFGGADRVFVASVHRPLEIENISIKDEQYTLFGCAPYLGHMLMYGCPICEQVQIGDNGATGMTGVALVIPWMRERVLRPTVR